MIEKIIKFENITLDDLLTVDTHGKKILIEDRLSPKPVELIANRQTFFKKDGLFANVKNNEIERITEHGKHRINFNDFLNKIDHMSTTCIIFIEGFAGCGKSTLVQYILLKQLNTYNYDYNLYNYDLESQNDMFIYDKKGKKIKKSSIFNAIKICFFEQYIKMAKKHSNVINDFNYLLEQCRYFSYFKNLYHNFYNTQTYDLVKDYIKDIKNKEKIILKTLVKQSETIGSSSEIFALDYLLRLAMYKNRIGEKLYICYDNLDAIEDAEDLKDFDDKLVAFKDHLNKFIIFINGQDFFKDLAIPHFIIMATYRKITASMANIAETTYKEVRTDERIGNKNNSVFYLDATSVFSYSEIVKKRKEYFETYFKSVTNIKEETKNKIMKSFNSWNKLNQTLKIMDDRYACLWNKNYRTCSLIADKLYNEDFYEFQKCVDFIERSKVNDGYHTFLDSDNNNIVSTYYGGSAILLSSVCRVFNTNHIWDNFLNLTPLNPNETSVSYKNVSFARLILTYIYNKNIPVSLTDLYNAFCKNNLFDYNDLCNILSKMLARNLNGVWRRPIYYAEECILSESADQIKSKLVEECKMIKEKDICKHAYKFLLCDSGQAYIERLMQEFEFFSNRISNRNKALYLYSDIESIDKIIKEVFNVVSNCCDNMLAFKDEYIKISQISLERYLELNIHPKTNFTKSSQLHTERTIFSHIAYLNHVRLYFINKNKQKIVKNAYNELFTRYIRKYLNLYNTKILPLSSKREFVSTQLGNKVNQIIKAIENNIDDHNILFQSISL